MADDKTPRTVEQMLGHFGLTADVVDRNRLSTANGPVVFSGDKETAGKRTMLTFESLEDVRRIFAVKGGARQSGVQPFGRLKSWGEHETDEPAKLSKQDLDRVYRGAMAYAFGYSDDASFGDILAAVHGPLRVAGFFGDTIDIFPNNPLIISSEVPVILRYETINIHPGGRILINAPGSLTTTNLNKL